MRPLNPNSNSRTILRPRVTDALHQGAREFQEDAAGYWLHPGGGSVFAIVADGAGGHGGGGQASLAAIQCAEKHWKSGIAKSKNPNERLATWMADAHAAVNQNSPGTPDRSGRAAVVAVLADGRDAHWIHAGDCRLYHIREGKILSRTRDDSVVQVLLEQGEIQESEMGAHPDQNRLLQSLGGEHPPTPRHGSCSLLPNDILLLCSDGLWERLTPHEIEALATAVDPPSALREALETAAKRGGPKADNASAILLTFDPCPAPRSFPWLPLFITITLILLGVLLAARAGYLPMPQVLHPIIGYERDDPTPDQVRNATDPPIPAQDPATQHPAPENSPAASETTTPADAPAE